MSDTQEPLDNEEYEEICGEEVDRIVESLDRLIEGVQSENVKHLLEEAASNIYFLVYEEETNGECVSDDDLEAAA
ncbi:MAG: hypothetical protein ACO3FE_01520 [Planctomycetaceae bacterium]